jgi:protein-L-isoaspartate O-methyltransferase
MQSSSRRFVAMSIAQKLIAGGPGRITRLPCESGGCISLRETMRLPKAIAGYAATKLSGRRRDEPWWPLSVIPLLDRHLHKMSRVLEFGSGSSTVWLAARAGSVLSIEDDPVWHHAVQTRLAALGLRNAIVHYAAGSAYYDLAWADDASFDLVVVDGSYRWKCIEAVLPRVRPGGIIYLDNSDADKDRLLYSDPSMRRQAQRLLQDFARENSGVCLTRHAGLINGELHAGEGMMLKFPER